MKIINHPDGSREVIYYDSDGNWYCTEWKNVQGQIHREGDLPAIEFADGQKNYYVNGELHRDHNLPAVEYLNGTKLYCVHGELHRTNGPAVESPNEEDNEWCLNDISYSKQEYFEKIMIMKKDDKNISIINEYWFPSDRLSNCVLSTYSIEQKNSCKLCNGKLTKCENDKNKFCSKCGIWG